MRRRRRTTPSAEARADADSHSCSWASAAPLDITDATRRARRRALGRCGSVQRYHARSRPETDSRIGRREVMAGRGQHPLRAVCDEQRRRAPDPLVGRAKRLHIDRAARCDPVADVARAARAPKGTEEVGASLGPRTARWTDFPTGFAITWQHPSTAWSLFREGKSNPEEQSAQKCYHHVTRACDRASSAIGGPAAHVGMPPAATNGWAVAASPRRPSPPRVRHELRAARGGSPSAEGAGPGGGRLGRPRLGRRPPPMRSRRSGPCRAKPAPARRREDGEAGAKTGDARVGAHDGVASMSDARSSEMDDGGCVGGDGCAVVRDRLRGRVGHQIAGRRRPLRRRAADSAATTSALQIGVPGVGVGRAAAPPFRPRGSC